MKTVSDGYAYFRWSKPELLPHTEGHFTDRTFDSGFFRFVSPSINAYYDARSNGTETDNPGPTPILPADGEFSGWIKCPGRNRPPIPQAGGTFKEGWDGPGYYCIRYTAGENDTLFMQRKDVNYLSRIAKSDPEQAIRLCCDFIENHPLSTYASTPLAFKARGEAKINLAETYSTEKLAILQDALEDLSVAISHSPATFMLKELLQENEVLSYEETQALITRCNRAIASIDNPLESSRPSLTELKSLSSTYLQAALTHSDCPSIRRELLNAKQNLEAAQSFGPSDEIHTAIEEIDQIQALLSKEVDNLARILLEIKPRIRATLSLVSPAAEAGAGAGAGAAATPPPRPASLPRILRRAATLPPLRKPTLPRPAK